MKRLIAGTFFVIIALLTLGGATQAAFPPVKFIAVSSPVPRGGTATLTIQTLASTPCVITVFYRSGPSKASGLVPKVADSRGRITWTWKVGTRTTPGRWPIRVECGEHDITRIETEFTVF
jgi:hypothetical protein